MEILGISCFYHNSAVALVRDGTIEAAVEEERFTRLKNDSSFPEKSMEYCIKRSKKVDLICFYEKPIAKLIRRYRSASDQGKLDLETYRPIYELAELRGKLSQLFGDLERVRFAPHHGAHAAAAFFCSSFRDAVVVVADGVGEFATTSIFIGTFGELKLVRQIDYPHSLGLAYSAITRYLGFRPLYDEYKIMGLAAYGRPCFVEQLQNNLIRVHEDGSFSCPNAFVDLGDHTLAADTILASEFGPSRDPQGEISPMHADIAASIQAIAEDALLKICHVAQAMFPGVRNLCLAGGVSLNCKANGAISKTCGFEQIFIHPAAGDAGGALGAALLAQQCSANGKYSLQRGPFDPYLGPEYSDSDIESTLQSSGVPFRRLVRDELLPYTARSIAGGAVVGWFQGRMEFGPRALGSRSILADPRSTTVAERLNRVVKGREQFRPFAPSVVLEAARTYFDASHLDRYMLLTVSVRSDYRRQLPAITHVDGSARIQVVDPNLSPLFYDLLRAFEEITRLPILLNTSFNHSSEPIVCSPQHAVDTFLKTEIDLLVIGSFVAHRIGFRAGQFE